MIRAAQSGRITQDKRGRVRLDEVLAALRPRRAGEVYSVEDYVNAPQGAYVPVRYEEAAGLRDMAGAKERELTDKIRHYVEKRKAVGFVIKVLERLEAGDDPVFLSRDQREAIAP